MLNRNDLAKQFELIVKQEIKNHKDSLNFILQSLRDLRKEIQEIKEDSLENYAAIHAQQCLYSIEFDNYKKDFADLSSKLDRYISDQAVINDRNAYANSCLKDSVNEKEGFQDYLMNRVVEF